MAVVHDEGIAVHCTPYSETSLIVVWITRGHGILRTLAKGARRPRQPLFGKIDVLRHGTLGFRPARTSGLHTLAEFTPAGAYPGVASDYTRLLAASYFYELIARLAEPQAAIPELHELYLKALAHLESHPVTPAIVHRFERRALEILGLYDAGAAPGLQRRRLLQPLPGTWKALVREVDGL